MCLCVRVSEREITGKLARQEERRRERVRERESE